MGSRRMAAPWRRPPRPITGCCAGPVPRLGIATSPTPPQAVATAGRLLDVRSDRLELEGWGAAGAWSVAYGLAIVITNFLLASWSLARAARISLALMAGMALFGFLIRLGLITVAVLVVRNASWVELVPLGLTLIVTHLGLLFWEMRFVSASLAFPGLKPKSGLDAASTSSPTISNDLSDTKEHQ